MGSLLRSLAILVSVGFALSGVLATDCPPIDSYSPRTLILALDGVPYESVLAAQEMGAFEGWAKPRPMVSPFPSMTNVGFAAILQPFGAGPIPGYEVRHYDPEANNVGGGGAFSLKFDWREQFEVQLEGFWDKVGLYMSARKNTFAEMKHVEKYVLGSDDELLMALISSTDALTHFQGRAETVRILLRLSDRIEDLRRRHEALHGRPLSVVMLSDHGNVGHKVRRPSGMNRILKGAGLNPSKGLTGPDDVVPVTYGVVGYGALYLDPANAEKAARAVLKHRGVHLSAWRVDEREVRLVSKDGEASLFWRDGKPHKYYAYQVHEGDPLHLKETEALMRSLGVADEHGFATRDDWFEWTAFSDYPDSPTRLVESLNGAWVSNAATVMFSFKPGYAWGIKSANVGAWVKAGRLEATHGGLDRESTWGFFLTSDTELETSPAVRADLALREWALASYCTTASLIHFGGDGHERLHGLRLAVP
jgi:hypothetical protein